MVRQQAPHAQIWAGEHGPIGGGLDGTCGVAATSCGSYATTMWYADDLATRAKAGFSQYQRQDFFGGAYGLTNSLDGEGQSLSPTDPLVLRPDYWTNFVWKRTIGTDVLSASSSNSQVRAYAFAGRPPSPFAADECKEALQFLLINLNQNTTSVELPPDGVSATWTLTPTSEGPFSRHVLLNGAQLPAVVDMSKSAPDTFLQEMPAPARKPAGHTLSLPPLSTTFACIVTNSAGAVAV